MKVTKVLGIFTCASLFLSLVACSGSSNKANEEQQEQDSVVVVDDEQEQVVAEKSSETEYQHTFKNSPKLSFVVSYKTIDSLKGTSKGADKIFEELTYIATKHRSNDFLSSAKAHADSLNNQYINDFEAYPEDLPAYEYSDEITINRFYQDNHILVAHLFQYSFEGGAHGNYGSEYYIYDINSGFQYKLSDFFSDDAKNVLTEKIVDYFVKAENLTKPEDLLNVGFLDLKQIKVTENFYVDKEGIGFVYNPYEIACYANGTETASFKWSEVSSLLKPNSPVSYLLNK